MRFKDIQVGDKVLVKKKAETVSVFGGSKSYRVAVDVERVTQAQFIAGGLRFKKDRGIGIGHDSCASVYTESDDQTDELLSENKRVRAKRLAMYNIKAMEKVIANSNDVSEKDCGEISYLCQRMTDKY